MNKKLLTILTITASITFATAADFTSFQLASTTLTNGNVLQTNGRNNVWVTPASLGLATGTNFWTGTLGGAISNLNLGNIGIGTTTPGAKLDITSSAGVMPFRALYPNGSSAFEIEASGRIGIGTSTAQSLLTISSTTMTGTSPMFSIGTTTNSFLTVLANGNVGVGTTTPQFPFHAVSPAGGASSNFEFQGLNTGVRILLQASDRNAQFGLVNGSDLGVFGANGLFVSAATPKILRALNGNQTTNYFQIDTDSANRTIFHGFNGGGTGAVGSTTLSFDTNGMTGIGTTSPMAQLYVQSQATSTINAFAVASSSGTNYFTITSTGNVGVATDTPGVKLAVNGDSYLAGNISATGTISNPGGDLNINGNGGNVNIQSFGGTSFRVRNSASTVLAGTFGLSSTIAGSGGGATIAGFTPIWSGTQTVPFWGIKYVPTVSAFTNSSTHYGLYIDPSAINTGTVYSGILLGGNVGIATTTPVSILTVASSSATGTTGLFEVATSTPLFDILANGNVGIRNSSPAQRLDVNGNINVNSGSSIGLVANAAIQYTSGNLFNFLFSGAQRVQIGSSYTAVNSSGSYRWTSDSNANTADTYLQRTGVSTVALSSNGTTGVANLNVLGNLGVGTTTSFSALSVSSSTATGAVGLLEVGSTSPLFAVLGNGAVKFNNDAGTAGYVLQSFGASAPPQWVATSSLGITGGGGGVSGGTAGFLARFTSPTSVSAGIFMDDGTVGGIGATSTATLFNVRGTSGSANSIFNVASSSLSSFFNVQPTGNIGIGTSTPTNLLSIANSTGNVLTVDGATPGLTDFLFQVASSTNYFFGVQGNGHVAASSTSPTLSSCGTSPSIRGNDTAGEVTVGSVSATACTITFANAYANSPSCVVQNQTGSITNTFSYTISTTAIVVTETGLTGNKLDYHCIGINE